MAINHGDVAEWFESYDRMDDEVYGVMETAEGWKVLKKEWRYYPIKISEIAHVDSRKAAIGIIKLLVEK
jgi:hypothetical protein